GDELVPASAGGDDIVAINDGPIGLNVPDIAEAPGEAGVIKERHSEGSAAASPALKNPPTPLAGCEYIHSPVSGLILHRKPLGAKIRPGEVVAE
ncbi:MAG TPA: hypothetical protein DCL47_01390, partial [Pantoea agglomerans]|nr:hypothetical protein [Pantoea agglomerans]